MEVMAGAVRENPNLPAFFTIVSDHQMAGRGRNERIWFDDGSALLFTTLLRLDAASMNLAAGMCGIAVAGALEKYGISAQLKWPNDVLVSGRKIAGILCEHLHVEPGDKHVVAAGIGLNISGVPKPVENQAIAVKNAAELKLSDEALRTELLREILRELQEVDGLEPEQILARYAELLAGLGQETAALLPGDREVHGTICGLGANGALRLRTAGGEVEINVGDIDLVRGRDA